MAAALGWGGLAASSLVLGVVLAFVRRWPSTMIGVILAFVVAPTATADEMHAG